MPIKLNKTLKILKQALVAKQNFIKTLIKIFGCYSSEGNKPTPCSFGLSATSQQYFSLRTNQPSATSQQYFSLRTNQHRPSATSQTNTHIKVVMDAMPPNRQRRCM
jgi:hypothetical protein